MQICYSWCVNMISKIKTCWSLISSTSCYLFQECLNLKKKQLEDSITINCNDCAAAKISWKIHHEFRFNEKNLRECLAIDFHDFNSNFRNLTFMIIITDHWSNFIWDFYLSSHSDELIINFLTWFFNFFK